MTGARRSKDANRPSPGRRVPRSARPAPAPGKPAIASLCGARNRDPSLAIRRYPVKSLPEVPVNATTLWLFGAAALALSAQPRPATPPLAFEVASVKPAGFGPNGVRGGCHGIDSVYTPGQQAEAPPLGRCVITDARLSHLIGIAFDVSMQELESGPDWIARGDARFNVGAKAENPSKATQAQLLTMLQNLLVERFQLKYHRRTKDMPGFALVVGNSAPKLQPTHSQDVSTVFTNPDGSEVFKPRPGAPISMKARKYTIAMLVSLLSMTGHGPGMDKTGLTGEYDFTLSWDDNAGPALSTALREQLGLRMESAKVPVSIFVVDSAARPSAN